MAKSKNTLGKILVVAGMLLAPLKSVDADPSWMFGLSAPCHGLVAARGEYNFNDNVGVQADIGLLSGIDVRARVPYAPKSLTGMNAIERIQENTRRFCAEHGYIYAGVLGISPWTYLLVGKTPAQADGPVFALEAGVGWESNYNKKGWTFGIEGGIEVPIPLDPNTGAFRIDVFGGYRFPIKPKNSNP